MGSTRPRRKLKERRRCFTTMQLTCSSAFFLSSQPVRVLALWATALVFVAVVLGCRVSKEEPPGAVARDTSSAGPALSGSSEEVFKQTRRLMGTLVTVQVAGGSEEAARRAVEEAFAEIERIEAMAHPRGAHSAVRRINEAAGREPVEVPEEIYEVLDMARRVSEHSGGAFDVTFAAVGRLWDFSSPEATLPSKEDIGRALELVGYRKLVLDAAGRRVFLAMPHMEIGLGAIAKGFAVDRAMEAAKKYPSPGILIEAGGDIRQSGSKHGRPWAIGLQDPRKPRGSLYGILEIEQESAVVTSGDYERGFVRGGIRYHHIIDPRTGAPARWCRSVTIVGPSCALADALATAVFVLGPQRGLEMLAAHYPDYDAFILDAQANEHASPGFGRRTRFERVH